VISGGKQITDSSEQEPRKAGCAGGRFNGAILRGSYLGNLAGRGFFRSPGSESRATNPARGYRFAARMLRDISQMQTWLRKRVEN